MWPFKCYFFIFIWKVLFVKVALLASFMTSHLRAKRKVKPICKMDGAPSSYFKLTNENSLCLEALAKYNFAK